jgi:hypothetical protein
MVSHLRQRIIELLGGTANAPATVSPPTAERETRSGLRTTFDGYVHTAPSAQNAVDLFDGEWSSRFPESCGVEAGSVPLAADDRLRTLEEAFDSLSGWTVLELGPLEGMHSYMLEQMGAASIRAIEGSGHAFLRCLITKEILGLQRAHFELGDFNYVLDETSQRFDLVLASGVLYHQIDPCRMLAGASRVAPRLYLWTHYFDEAMFDTRPYLARRFTATKTTEFEGKQFTLHVYQYAEALERKDFCGGQNETSNWMTLEDLDAVLVLCGYEQIVRNLDTEHPNGPCVTMVLSKPV